MLTIDPHRAEPRGRGPQPSSMPAAAIWEWNALIAVALDGTTMPRIQRRPTTAPVAPVDPRHDRLLVLAVAILAALAAVLSLLLI
jgi:hypothetical protein